ncbi:uncharacterized protein LOC141890922 [Acropora palmata]|uniref:uncharacterized protein LOC141890922 n=1 Tax=Acropora palmata TaxID=6131 RepID=UPI003DA0EA63
MTSTSTPEDSLQSHVKGLEFLKEIGKGSYGIVYRAKWNGEEVAAKRFHPILFENGVCQESMRDFQREREVLEATDHPNIVKLKTVLLPEGVPPIIITELLHCDLEKYIRVSKTSPKVSEKNLIRIATDVIKGLEYMHGLDPPIVHRDLATKNILLTVHGNAKIADFGVSKAFSAGRDMYASSLPGTPVYAAPETYPAMNQYQIVGAAMYGPKVDVFSFGAVLLCMIVGHEPRVRPLSPITKDGVIIEHERRKMDIAEMGEHSLKELVVACLQNDSKLRPEVSKIKDGLKKHTWRLVQRCDHCGSNKIPIERVARCSVHDYKFKLLFIGDMAVGKSCLFNRFLNPEYKVAMSTTTLSIEMDRLSIKYGSKFLDLEVIDTAGQEQYFAIQAMYFRRVHGIFLVCDVTNHVSFEHIPRWLKMAQTYCTEENTFIILIGNKIDQVADRQVSSEEGHSIARSQGLTFVEASAFHEESIEEMLWRMIQLLTNAVDMGLIKSELPKLTDRVKLEKPPKKSNCSKCKKQ